MNDRARTSKQKAEVLDRIYQAWVKCPELRLGQLLFNVFGRSTFIGEIEHQQMRVPTVFQEMDIFNIEDFPLVDKIDKKVAEWDKNEKNT